MDAFEGYKQDIPEEVRLHIRRAIDHIENARMVLTPHRPHIKEINDVVGFLGKLQIVLGKIHAELPQWIKVE